MSEITTKEIENYQEQLNKTAHNNALRRAVMNNGINNASEEEQIKKNLQTTFSHELKTSKVTAQKHSGRCWLFAALNTLRFDFEQTYNVKQFEFSQNYLSFWDRVEKANMFLTKMIETYEVDDNDRRIQMLMQEPDPDGGQWANAVALIEKYGLVPKYVMPETKVSNNTEEFEQVISKKLRLDAKKIREALRNGKTKDEAEKMKERAMAEVYRMCVYSFGNPVEKFDLEFKDKDNKLHTDYQITPLDFYHKYTKANLSDYVVISNVPDRDYDKRYTMPDEDNVVGGPSVVWLNLKLEEFKQITLKQLLDGHVTWFACDVLQQMSREEGLLANDLYNHEELFDIDLQFTKADRFRYHEACMSHAMAFTGVNLVNDQPNRWKVENSWGDKIGADGYFVMDDKWFDEYTYESVIHKKYLPKDKVKLLDQKPIHLDLWDSMA